MSKGNYILVNRSFLPAEEYRLSLLESEALQFSEKIRAIRSAFPFFSETLELVKLKLNLFNHVFPEFTDHNGAGLIRQLERTLTKNKHFLDAFLTLTFRFSDQKVSYSIQSAKLETSGYTLNEKGIYVEIFDQFRKSVASLSTLSIGSEMIWQIAQAQTKNSVSDEKLILNTENLITEAPYSNIYIVKGKSIIGSGINHGAYVDITTQLMLDIFRKMNLSFSDSDGISIRDLQEADEILLVNSIEGIRWIAGFEGKRYFNNTIRRINELFNQMAIS
jgi:branched-subunit amino acid aminotransferase/4-amino-4-deoxychorismate lyase